VSLIDCYFPTSKILREAIPSEGKKGAKAELNALARRSEELEAKLIGNLNVPWIY
jgi:hypothetical protein